MKNKVFGKQLIITIVFAMFTMIVASACNNLGERTNTLTVSDVSSDPLAFTGEIAVTGVLSKYDMFSANVFWLTDTNEILTCKNLYCDTFLIIVQYDGDDSLPKLGDEIVLQGFFSEDRYENFYVFKAHTFSLERNVLNILS